MRSLFRSFERSGVEYLLISGQASVLYGAALFSEDIDIWLRPTAAAADRGCAVRPSNSSCGYPGIPLCSETS